jgi:hypothetical protein
MNGKQIAVSLLAGVTACLLLLIVVRSIRVRQEGGYVDPHRAEMFGKWKSQSFTPITKSDEFVTEVNSSIESQARNTGLDAVQVSRLGDAVKMMLFAFSSGSYQDYARFRFPSRDGSFDPNRVDSLYKGLRDYDPKFRNYSLDATDPQFAWKVFERFWIFSGIETNLYCSKCWEELSLRSLKVQVFARTNIVLELRNIMEHEDNVGINWWNPAFVSSPTPQQLVQKQGYIDLVTVSVVIKTEITTRVTEQTNVSPIYCQFYWIPEKGLWFPCSFGGAYSGFRKALYLY